MTKRSWTYDHIVVGSGSAGSVVARRLVDAGRRVALLEAGGPDTHPAIRRPDAMVRLRGTANDYAFVTEPQEGLSGRRIAWPRGKVLGGSSAINGMIHVRGHFADYDSWAYRGADGWSYQDVLPAFIRSEDHEDGASDVHGAGGPLPVRRNPTPHPISLAFLEAGHEAGLPRNDDHNGREIYGIGLTHLNILDGERYSSWRAFAEPVLGSGLLDVHTDALVTRVIFDRGRATGVTYRREGQERTIHAEGDIVLSGGALASPQLLQLSGIGPAAELRRLGVPVLVDAPDVGENLHEHALSQVVWASRRPVDPSGHPPLEVQLFADSRPGLVSPDIQPVNGLFAYPIEGYSFPAGQTYTWFPGIVRPRSRGKLRLESDDAAVLPRVDPAYLRESVDVEALVEAIELCRELGRQRALDEWNAGEIAPGPEVRTRGELREYARRSLDTYFHPVGTVRMGSDDRAVLDPRLRVRGVEGLRVADASVFPEIPAGNTHAPAVMVGERAAEFVIEES